MQLNGLYATRWTENESSPGWQVDRLPCHRVAASAGPSFNHFKCAKADDMNSFAAQELALNNREDLVNDASSVLVGNPAVPFVNCTS